MSRRSPVTAGIVLGLLVGVLGSFAVVKLGGADVATPPVAQAAAAAPLYAGDPELESRLVRLEAQRLVYVRTLAASAQWNPAMAPGPFRLQTGAGYTLVLPARAEPYTVGDLAVLAPDTFRAGSEGEYLLSESIVVLAGATLAVSPPDGAAGLRIRLASDRSNFVSIVSAGGVLRMDGRADAPIVVESWDSARGAPDTFTPDGRAYVRVIGGRAAVSHTAFGDLGFWSGTTGGLAFTGTKDAADFDAQLAARDPAAPPPLEPPTPAAAPPPGTAPPLENSETQELASPSPSAPQAVAGAQILAAPLTPEFPTGPAVRDAAAPAPDPAAPAARGLVSARLDHVTVTGNAFGLFATSASGVVIRDSAISKSLIDGLVFHRHVTASSVARTSSVANAVDGFSLSRSSTDVSFTDVTARDNGRDGLALDGQPLAEGPSATGTEVRRFGDNRVTGSDIVHNGRHGIAVKGGDGVVLSSNTVRGNQSGVVVDHDARDVQIVANVFVDQKAQSIALRDGVDAEVATNRITGGDTAVYVRNADAAVTNNTIAGVSNHGVSLVGDAAAARVERNTIAGYGNIPVYTERATGGIVRHNDTSDWRPAPSIATVLNALFQPLTLVWIGLALLVLVTAITPAGRRATTIRHPYAERAPLSSFTRGVVSRESIEEARR